MTNDHDHPEIEDRITAELALVHTELRAINNRIDLLRSDTNRGFDAVNRGLEAVTDALKAQGETLREILEALGTSEQ